MMFKYEHVLFRLLRSEFSPIMKVLSHLCDVST